MKNNKNNHNQFLKKIELKNGILDFANTIELYRQYLATPRLDWQNEIRRPIKSAIYSAMCATHIKYGEDPKEFIEDIVKKGGKLYFWSDLHLFHNNIIGYAGRPFETVDHMNQTIIGNYWSTVTENDIVVFGGDVGFGEVEEVSNLLKNLPGKKVLVLGNHDFDKNKCIYRNYHVFDMVTMAFSLQKEINNEIYNILITHYPLHVDVLPENTINIHGHIHQHMAGEKKINMSVEHTNFSPKDMSDKIHELIYNIEPKKRIKNGK